MQLLNRLFRHARKPQSGTRMSTSFSDNQTYPQICLQAAGEYTHFNRFRQNPVYTQILEHVSPEQGREYLRLAVRDKELFGALEELKRNDLYGGPCLHEYPDAGGISPSTLRYIKVLADLRQLFGSLDELTICEIGVGYGGQCRIINAMHAPGSYTLVDIQPALSLAQRYLDNYILNSPVTYKTMNELRVSEHDLVISNYAFSELPRLIQDVYLAKIVLRSRRGYITYNHITPPEFQTYTADEILRMIPNARILPEEPLTHAKNCVIVWGVT
jgi:hypothetical protein